MIEQIIKDKDIERLNDIYRWSFYKVHKHENIPQHSYWVMFFSNLLIEELNPEGHPEDVLDFKLKVLQYALYHDVDEIFTGDISHEVKSNPYNGEKLKDLLSNLARVEMLNKFGNLKVSNVNVINSTLNKDVHISTIVKLADWLSFIKFAYNETLLGNTQFNKILEYCTDKVKKQSYICIDSLIEYGSTKTNIKFDFKILQEVQTIKLT